MGIEEREIIRQSAGMIASALGEGWTVNADPDRSTWNVEIDGPDDERLYLSKGNKAPCDSVTRLCISGGYGHLAEYAQMPYQLQRAEITVSRDRGPEVIAKEIRRRLFPTYHAEMSRIREAVDRSTNAAKLRGELAARLGGREISHSSSESRTVVSVPGGSITINYEATGCSVDLYSCPVDVAVLLAEALRKAEEG